MSNNKQENNSIKEWIKTIILAIIIAGIISIAIKPVRVDGLSMYPTFNENDYMIVNKLSYKFTDIKRGDNVVAKVDDSGKEKLIIKRVIAIPGDYVEIKNGNVYINGEIYNESYINQKTYGNVNIKVPSENVFLLGDNREISKDSREIGCVSFGNIVGKVAIRLYPFNKIALF